MGLDDGQKIKLVQSLLSKATPFQSQNSVLDHINRHYKPGTKYVVGFLNMYAVQVSLINNSFFQSLLSLDLLLLDGIGIEMLSKVYGYTFGKNMNGTDLIPKIIDHFNKADFYLFGTTDAALEYFNSRYNNINVIAKHNGFKEISFYQNLLDQHKPNTGNMSVVLLGMGMPKQEILARQIRTNSFIVNGGAIIDYLSGFKKRSPRFFVYLRIEWIYRMFYEPKRLFMRYISGIIELIKLSVLYKIKF